jgi:hypothetical protein
LGFSAKVIEGVGEGTSVAIGDVVSSTIGDALEFVKIGIVTKAELVA